MEQSHSLTLSQREKLTVTGVSEVVSFDETAATLHTVGGELTVLGSNLQLKSLDTGTVIVTGTVDAVSYEKPFSGGWLKRLLG